MALKRIIRSSNFDREDYDEGFVGLPMEEDVAKALASDMNRREGDMSPHHYKVVDLDYQLQVWEP